MEQDEFDRECGELSPSVSRYFNQCLAEGLRRAKALGLESSSLSWPDLPSGDMGMITPASGYAKRIHEAAPIAEMGANLACMRCAGIRCTEMNWKLI